VGRDRTADTAHKVCERRRQMRRAHHERELAINRHLSLNVPKAATASSLAELAARTYGRGRQANG